MCTAKAPKAPTAPAEKPVQYLSNPWVDGLGIGGASARGRNSLRIDAPARVPVTVSDPGLPSQTPIAEVNDPSRQWALGGRGSLSINTQRIT